ncbi:unnamed protein product [Staurois parvus]|uniref:Uncharacterized protein n=1 Tax=Staurois parvus TaxID=386267 RepID=A0ABN9DMU4_9NEOB|nr:unnamed protein product [Staurois parvus]
MIIKIRFQTENSLSAFSTGEALLCWKAGPVPHSLRFLRIRGIRWSIYTGWCRMDMGGSRVFSWTILCNVLIFYFPVWRQSETILGGFPHLPAMD